MDTEITKFHGVINFVSSHGWCIGQVFLFCSRVILDLRFKASCVVRWVGVLVLFNMRLVSAGFCNDLPS